MKSHWLCNLIGQPINPSAPQLLVTKDGLQVQHWPSKGPMDSITWHDYANDVAAVLKKLGESQAVIVGHAFGHWVARTTGLDYPGMVRGVAIVAAAAKNYPAGMAEHVAHSADLSRPD